MTLPKLFLIAAILVVVASHLLSGADHSPPADAPIHANFNVNTPSDASSGRFTGKQFRLFDVPRRKEDANRRKSEGVDLDDA